jgi:hypothetical protein
MREHGQQSDEDQTQRAGVDYEVAFQAGFDAGLQHAQSRALANFEDALSLIERSVVGQIGKARKTALRQVSQCQATISNPPRRGKQCRKPNLPGSEFCAQHQGRDAA